jgi:exopolyphosphatase / guanosine-5'-triphosphate,3'-diphosphate pyrophosphatase
LPKFIGIHLRQRRFGRPKACENYHKVKTRQAIFSGFAARRSACYEQPEMRCAVIDIGTNTIKVLVADVQQGKVVPVFHQDRVTRLGESVDKQRCLSADAIDRALRAIDQFHLEARAAGALHIIALTTSACREATNRNEFFDEVRQRCRLEVQMISGEREAELIFQGVSSDPEWAGVPLLVMDVGGGSVEFIQGREGKMELCQSLPLGALRLTEKFGEGKSTELGEYVRKVLRPVLAGYEFKGRRLIGTGGTITTLARVMKGDVDHVTISRAELLQLVRRLEAMPLVERRQVPGLPPERADIIVAGGAVFLAAMELLGAEELTVSVRNLRYGALLAG